MEVLLAILIATYVVKNGVIDASYALRGKPSPRQELAKTRAKTRAARTAARTAAGPKRSWRSGPAARYFGQRWTEAWDDAQERHTKRRTARAAKPRQADGAARSYVRGVRRDASQWAWARWDTAWYKAEARRRGPAPADLIVQGETLDNTADTIDTATSDRAGNGPGSTFASSVTVPTDERPTTETTRSDVAGSPADDAPRRWPDGVRKAWLLTKPDGRELVNLDGRNLDLYAKHGYGITPVWGIPTAGGFRIVDEGGPSDDGLTAGQAAGPTTDAAQDEAISTETDYGWGDPYGFSKITIPSEAEQPCRHCADGTLRPVQGTVHADEGDGGAMVDTNCDSCSVQSYHSWPLPDDEYEAVFGHAFDDYSSYEDDDPEDGGVVSAGSTTVPAGASGGATTTTGRNTAMSSSIPTGEAPGLTSAIAFCSQSADAAEQAVNSIETLIASLNAGEVGGGTTGHLAKAQEQFSAAAAALRQGEQDLTSHLSVAEAYHANPDAGSREFVTNG